MKKYLYIGIAMIMVLSCSPQQKNRGTFKIKITSYKSSQIKFDDETNDYTVLTSGDTIRNVNDGGGSTKFLKFDKIDSTKYLIKVMYVGGKDANMGGKVVLEEENTFILSPTEIKKAPNNCCLDISLVIFEITTKIKNPMFKNSLDPPK
jgi:hypothetical protein